MMPAYNPQFYQKRPKTPAAQPGAPAVAPPPPKPPTAPNFQQMATVAPPQARATYQARAPQRTLQPEVTSFARQTLQTPSRFDIPLVQQGTELIKKQTQRSFDDARRRQLELHAERGTLGGSPEREDVKDLNERLADIESQRLFDLNMALAQTQAADRGLAGQLALQAGEFGRGLDADETLENRYAAEFGRLTGRDLEDDIRARAGLQLQGGQLGFGSELASAQFAEDASRFRAGFGEGQRQFDAQTGLQNRGLDIQEGAQLGQEALALESLGQRAAEFGGDLGLRERALAEQARQFNVGTGFTQQDIDLRARQLQQQAQLQGRSLDLQEARDQAGQQLERERLTQQARQFGQDLGLRRDMFASDDDFRRAQAAQQARQFERGISSQEALEEARRGLEYRRLFGQEGLEGRRLDLSERQFNRGIQSQEALAEAQRALEYRRLFGQEGLTRDQMAQQARQFERGLSAEEAMEEARRGLEYRRLFGQEDIERSRLGQQERQFNVDAQIRNRALDLEQSGMNQRDALERARMEWQAAQNLEDRKQRYFALEQDESQFGRSLGQQDAIQRLALQVQLLDAIGGLSAVPGDYGQVFERLGGVFNPGGGDDGDNGNDGDDDGTGEARALGLVKADGSIDKNVPLSKLTEEQAARLGYGRRGDRWVR